MDKKRSIVIVISSIVIVAASMQRLIYVVWFQILQPNPLIIGSIAISSFSFTLHIWALICGIGLFWLKNWARVLGVILLCVYSIINVAISFILLYLWIRYHEFNIWMWKSLELIPFILVIIYLTRPKVKEMFKK